MYLIYCTMQLQHLWYSYHLNLNVSKNYTVLTLWAPVNDISSTVKYERSGKWNIVIRFVCVSVSLTIFRQQVSKYVYFYLCDNFSFRLFFNLHSMPFSFLFTFTCPIQLLSHLFLYLYLFLFMFTITFMFTFLH